jgi:hypothetical protein
LGGAGARGPRATSRASSSRRRCRPRSSARACPRGPAARAELTPGSVLGLCGIGIAAWIVVLLLFLVVHVPLPDWLGLPLAFLLSFPFAWFVPIPVWPSLLVLFAAGIGVLAVGKARTRRAKWIVALVHFTAPFAYAALFLT